MQYTTDLLFTISQSSWQDAASLILTKELPNAEVLGWRNLIFLCALQIKR